MNAGERAKKWSLIGIELLLLGGVIAFVAGGLIAEGVVRADERGTSGSPSILLLLLTAGGAVIALSGLMTVIVHGTKWRMARADARA